MRIYEWANVTDCVKSYASIRQIILFWIKTWTGGKH